MYQEYKRIKNKIFSVSNLFFPIGEFEYSMEYDTCIHIFYFLNLNKDSFFFQFIPICSVQICARCEGPSYDHVIQAIEHLQVHIPKALVVLLGPVHVSSFHEQKSNLLKLVIFIQLLKYSWEI